MDAHVNTMSQSTLDKKNSQRPFLLALSLSKKQQQWHRHVTMAWLPSRLRIGHLLDSH